MKAKRKMLIFLFFLFVLKFFFALPLDNSLPGGTDTSSHLFKVWYISEKGISEWNRYWYGGFPLIKYYPPLSYLIPAAFSKFFGYLLSYKFVNNVFFSIPVFVFFFFLKEFKMRNEEMIIAILFFSLSPIYSYYLADGRYPSLLNITFGLLFWIFLKRSIDRKDKKNFIASSTFLSLGILTHHMTALCLIPIILLWAISYKFKLNVILNFSYIVILSLFLTAWWSLPFLIETFSFKYHGGMVEQTTPTSLGENLIGRFLNFKFFSLPFSKEILILLIPISFFPFFLSFINWKREIDRNFSLATIGSILTLFMISYKRAFIFLPIPVSILVATGVLKINPLKKFFCFLLVFLSLFLFFSIRTQTFQFPEYPNIPKDGRVIFLPLGDEFVEKEGEVKTLYSTMLSPFHGNENIYGWFIESQKIGAAGQKKMGYLAIISNPLSIDKEKYYEALREGWVNYIVVRKNRSELINYFNATENFLIFNETKDFIIFQLNPKSYYISIDGKDVEAFVFRSNGKISIRTLCKGKVVVKESYHENWLATLNGKNVKINPSKFGFIEFEEKNDGDCLIELEFNSPRFYLFFYVFSITIWIILVFLFKFFFN